VYLWSVNESERTPRHSAVGGRRTPIPVWIGLGCAIVLLAGSCTSGSPSSESTGGRSSQRSGAVKVDRGLRYADPDGQPLLLDAFVPSGGGSNAGVILIHGGGWQSGSRRMTDSLGMGLARKGFSAFSIDYRLAPPSPYPAALQDVQSAVRWVRSNATRFNVDPSELAVMGGSSGGNLALLLGAAGQGSLDSGSRVRVAVSWSGPSDLARLLDANIPRATSAVDAFAGCPGSRCSQNLRLASPATQVDASDAAMFIANSADEFIPFQQAQEIADACKRAAVPYQLVQVPGDGHSMAYARTQVPALHETVAEASIAFLQKWIGKSRS
jgi:acetyl esterase